MINSGRKIKQGGWGGDIVFRWGVSETSLRRL